MSLEPGEHAKTVPSHARQLNLRGLALGMAIAGEALGDAGDPSSSSAVESELMHSRPAS